MEQGFLILSSEQASMDAMTVGGPLWQDGRIISALLVEPLVALPTD